MEFKRELKNLLRDILNRVLGPINYTKFRFYMVHGYRLNFNDPKTWNEKVQFRKFNCNEKYISKFVDKYVVREYVKKLIGEEYLIPLLGVYEDIKVEDFNELPKSFVVKTSNGGGGENVAIVRDKENEDLEKLCKKFNSYLMVKIGEKINEPYYDVIKPKILIEKLLEEKDGSIPSDYKFHVFSRAKEIYIQHDRGRYESQTQDFYDNSWNVIDLEVYAKNSNDKVNPPNEIETMKKIAFKLAKEFSYLRVDLYNVDGKIYFGEMTFAPWNGFVKFKPNRLDKEWGKKWGKELDYLQ